MNPHKNARLTPYSRELMIERIRKRGWTVAKAAEAARVSERTAQSTIQPHSARYCSDLASPLLKAQQQNDKAQARLGFDAFDRSLFQGK